MLRWKILNQIGLGTEIKGKIPSMGMVGKNVEAS